MDVVNIFGVEEPEGRIDVARAVGSTAMAMSIYDLAPGEVSSPYHYEYEEEWLLVVEGTIVVRTPDGDTRWSAEISSASRRVPPERTR